MQRPLAECDRAGLRGRKYGFLGQICPSAVSSLLLEWLPTAQHQQAPGPSTLRCLGTTLWPCTRYYEHNNHNPHSPAPAGNLTGGRRKLPPHPPPPPQHVAETDCKIMGGLEREVEGDLEGTLPTHRIQGSGCWIVASGIFGQTAGKRPVSRVARSLIFSHSGSIMMARSQSVYQYR